MWKILLCKYLWLGYFMSACIFSPCLLFIAINVIYFFYLYISFDWCMLSEEKKTETCEMCWVFPWFLDFALYLHVCSSITRVHVSHLTWQHQWNLQLHLSFTTIFFVLYPRPQHRIAQPSKPDDVLLQTRLCVPTKMNRTKNFYWRSSSISSRK